MTKRINSISILIVTFILMFLIPNIVKADESINAGNVLSNENYYCVEVGQELTGTNTYETKKVLTFENGSNKNFLRGLGYILSYDIESNRGEIYSEGGIYIGYSSSEDHKQLALWRYIQEYPQIAKTEFGFNVFSPEWDKLIEGTDSGGTYLQRDKAYRYSNGQKVEPADPIIYKKSYYAYEIYLGAVSASNSNDNWEFEIECLQHSDNQNLIKVNSIKKQEPVITELEINKKDSLTEEKLSGAKFTITLKNISSAEGYSNNGNNTIIIPNIDTGYLNDNKGTISLKNLKVADPNGDITIIIKETDPPKGYKKRQYDLLDNCVR